MSNTTGVRVIEFLREKGPLKQIPVRLREQWANEIDAMLGYPDRRMPFSEVVEKVSALAASPEAPGLTDYEALAHLCLERHHAETGGCSCGFCIYSVEHVIISFARELAASQPNVGAAVCSCNDSSNEHGCPIHGAFYMAPPSGQPATPAIMGTDGREHFRVTAGCYCGWSIINDFEWEQHLKQITPATADPVEALIAKWRERGNKECHDIATAAALGGLLNQADELESALRASRTAATSVNLQGVPASKVERHQPSHDLRECISDLSTLWRATTGDSPAEKCMRSCGAYLGDILEMHAAQIPSKNRTWCNKCGYQPCDCFKVTIADPVEASFNSEEIGTLLSGRFGVSSVTGLGDIAWLTEQLNKLADVKRRASRTTGGGK